MSKNSYKTEVVVLRSYEMKEFDRIYLTFSRKFGKKKVLGISSRKIKARLSGGLEPLSFSEIFLVKGRFLDRVCGVILISQFTGIKQDLDTLLLIRRLFRLIEQLVPEEEPNDEFFEALVYWLNYVEENSYENRRIGFDKKERFLRWALLWKVIKWTGVYPELVTCFECRTKLSVQDNFKFLIPEGILCHNCEKKYYNQHLFRVDVNLIKMLRLIISHPVSVIAKFNPQKEQVLMLEKLTRTTLENILGRKLDF